MAISLLAGNHVTQIAGTMAGAMQAAKSCMPGYGKRQVLVEVIPKAECIDSIYASNNHCMEEDGFIQHPGQRALVHDGTRTHRSGPRHRAGRRDSMRQLYPSDKAASDIILSHESRFVARRTREEAAAHGDASMEELARPDS